MSDYTKINGVLDAIADLIDRQDFAEASVKIQGLERDCLASLSTVETGRLDLYAACISYHSAEYENALSRVNSAIAHFKHSDAHSLYGRAKCRRGYILLCLGRNCEAADDFREARFAYKRIDDFAGELDACNCLARCAFTEGQYEKAKIYLGRVLHLAKELGNVEQHTAMQLNLGRVLIRLGELHAAKPYMVIGPNASGIITLANQCRQRLSLAYLLTQLREFNEAEIIFGKALAEAKDNSFARELSIYHEYSGELCFWQDDYDKAEEHYREAIKIGEEIAPDGDIISQSCRLLAELQVARGQLDDAEESCNRAWAVAEKITERLELGAIQRTRGDIAARRGDADTARTAFAAAIRILSEIGAKYELARAHLQAGEARVFDIGYRRFNLGIALGLFERIGVEYWQTRTAEALNGLWRSVDPPTHSVFSRPKKTASGGPFIAASEPMQKILARVEQIKDTDATILLLGETGVGKDRLAEYIHQVSNRAGKPFESICVTAIAPQLWESELFGHAKGAFTGAGDRRIGRLERANGGTVYLNEISEIGPDLQAKFLEVLEHKRIQPVGGMRPVALDVRFIAASNRDLKKELDAGRFREDLFYRLNRVCLTLPPLRERRADIGELAGHFLQRYRFPLQKADRLLNDQSFITLLHDHDWPGNVRQLENVIWQLVQCADGSGPDRLVDLAREFLAHDKSSPDPEREKLLAILNANGWNQRETARELGISHTTISRKIKQFNIIPPIL